MFEPLSRCVLPGEAVFPEGIAEDPDGETFYVSSAADGTVFRARLGDPEAQVWLPAGADDRTEALGMAVDQQGRLLVCGWESGHVFAYDTATGRLAARWTVTAGLTGLNDVCVAGEYAYVTDSRRPVMWRVALNEPGGALAEWLDLAAVGAAPDSFLNGIVALGGTDDSGGPVLLVAAQGTAELWRVDASSRTAERVDLGGERVCADGLAAVGDLIYACDNDDADGTLRFWLTALRLSGDGRSGEVAGRWEWPVADTPTTLARVGGLLHVVNSQFVPRNEGRAAPPFTVGVYPVPRG